MFLFADSLEGALELNETAKQLFGGASTASALLSGFCFAAALQLVRSKGENPGQDGRGAVLLLYSATFLFLFAMIGFTNASARPIPQENGLPIDVLQTKERGTLTKSVYTWTFYRAYAAEFLLALFATLAFIGGVISSAWLRSPAIGKSILGVLSVILGGWV
ncbi:MAG: hypothetical protein AAGJ31_03395, partial [Verrucomicrobiota bacterium]